MVRLAGHQDSVALYGNIKSRPVVERKIRDFSSGCAALDLWDLVRFRLVVTSIDSVERVSQLLWSSFGADLLRCRNYYVRPGEGWGDPYRAIHFELKVGTRSPAECVEIQVLTARRDAVGLIDHGIHSKSSRYRDGKHECWLRSLSWTANIMDAEPGLEKSSLHTRPASADGGTVNVSPPCGDGVPASCRPRCRSTVRFSGK
jgi:hypothetical protein